MNRFTTDELRAATEDRADDLRGALTRLLQNLPAAPVITRAAVAVELERAAVRIGRLADKTAKARGK